MKKVYTVMLFVTLCAAPVFAQNGIITELIGMVELKPAGQADFIPAKEGDAVAQNTIISTGFKSHARITAGSSVILVRPLTRLSLAEISASGGTETLNISLQTGRVRADVKPPAGTRTIMAVHGPSATASVRGTSFEFDTQNLTVIEGTVAFQGSSGAVMLVGAGSVSYVTENGKAADPIETSTAQLLPPPLAGSDSGFRHSGTAAVPEETGTFNLSLELN